MQEELIKGGQGRDVDDVTASTIFFAVAIAGAAALLIVIGVCRLIERFGLFC